MKSIKQYWDEWMQSIAESNDQAFKDIIAEKDSIILSWEIQHEADRDYIAKKKEVILQKNIEILDLKYDLTAIQ